MIAHDLPYEIVAPYSSLGALENIEAEDPQVQALLADLIEQGKVEQQASDETARPAFVGLQALIESFLAEMLKDGTVERLYGLIHTPMPCTPLCVRPGEDASGLLHESMQNDPSRIQTVSERAVSLRALLEAGGKIGVVYETGGLQQRTTEQQIVFQETLEQFPDNLWWVELDGNVLSQAFRDGVGTSANYFFYIHPQVYFFSIHAPQAATPEEGCVWTIWLGRGDDDAVSQRCDQVALLIHGCFGNPYEETHGF